METTADVINQALDAPMSELREIWMSSLDDLATLAVGLTDEQWNASTGCPGWTAGDVVAHVVGLEAELHGDPAPDYTPDWDSLPLVTTPFAQYFELPVDYRRSHTQSDVVTELRELIAKRRDDLLDAPDNRDAPAVGPAGWTPTNAKFVTTRILDTWVHEQDIRVAAGIHGGLESPAALVTAAAFISGLPKVWGKNVGAPVGSTLGLHIIEPGIGFSTMVSIGDDGRAAVVTDTGTQPSTLDFTVTWPLFVQLSAGRDGAAQRAGAEAEIVGAAELAQKLITGLSSTP